MLNFWIYSIQTILTEMGIKTVRHNNHFKTSFFESQKDERAVRRGNIFKMLTVKNILHLFSIFTFQTKHSFKVHSNIFLQKLHRFFRFSKQSHLISIANLSFFICRLFFCLHLNVLRRSNFHRQLPLQLRSNVNTS